MLKNILSVLLLVASILTTSAFAKNETAGKALQLTEAVDTNTSIKNMPKQNFSLVEGENVISENVSEPEPFLNNAWLISIALLGFVMLSNRSGV